MMKRILFTFVILFSAISPLSAAVDWTEQGFDIVARGEENDIVLQKGEWRFLVVNESEAKPADAIAIDRMNTTFSSWKFIRIRNIKYVITQSSIDVFLIPRSFDYNGRSYMDNVVAGLQLVYSEEALRYSFRIKRGEMFLKISGVYIEEEVLTKKIEEAVADPQAFIQRRDADYLLNVVDRLEDKMDLLTADNIRVKEDISRLQASNTQLTTRLNATTKSAQNTKNVVVAYANDHIFYGAKPIPREKVTRILQMRQSYPTLSLDDLMDKFREIEYEVTKKEVEIVLQAYNNEFKK